MSAPQADGTSRRTMLAGMIAAIPVAPALAAPPAVSEVERAATAFFAAEGVSEALAAFNAVMRAPSESLDDMKVKLLVERRFSAVFEDGGNLAHHVGYAIYRDLCRLAGVPVSRWYA